MKCKCNDIFFLCNKQLGKILVYFEKNFAKTDLCWK
jgi:hypothetical protein